MKKLCETKGSLTGGVNISDIFTRLIKEAAKCKSYSSDVLYDVASVNETIYKLKLGVEMETATFYFGFREMGVDNKAFIEARGDNDHYRRILCLTIESDKDNVALTLWQQK